jgi:SAM-dependent methyltransferase
LFVPSPYRVIRGSRYWRCPRCAAVFLDPSQRPDASAERLRYLQHRNDPGDEGYRRFLGRLAIPLLERLSPHRIGLDYGCGPSPVLAQILEAAGHNVRRYDPFFYPDRSVLETTYSFIACCEVVEHFHRPSSEFAQFAKLLRPGGVLAIMTSFMVDDDLFENWHYRRDSTHVVFYSETTFGFLASQHGWTCEFPVENVVFLR